MALLASFLLKSNFCSSRSGIEDLVPITAVKKKSTDQEERVRQFKVYQMLLKRILNFLF